MKQLITVIWLLFKQRLLTNSERRRRHMTQDGGCQICDSDTEDIEHVFKHCTLAKALWKELLPPDQFREFTTTDLCDWLTRYLYDKQLHASWQIRVFVTCWQLWQARNARLFTDTSQTTSSIACKIRAIVSNSLRSFALVSAFL